MRKNWILRDPLAWDKGWLKIQLASSLEKILKDMLHICIGLRDMKKTVAPSLGINKCKWSLVPSGGIHWQKRSESNPLLGRRWHSNTIDKTLPKISPGSEPSMEPSLLPHSISALFGFLQSYSLYLLPTNSWINPSSHAGLGWVDVSWFFNFSNRCSLTLSQPGLRRSRSNVLNSISEYQSRRSLLSLPLSLRVLYSRITVTNEAKK